jgi:hypothetical protein
LLPQIQTPLYLIVSQPVDIKSRFGASNDDRIQPVDHYGSIVLRDDRGS